MALTDDIAVLSKAPLFNLMEPDALRLLAFAAEQKRLDAGEILFEKGDPSDGGYVVVTGELTLQQRPDAAAYRAGRGALVGQSALFCQQVRPATATAREPSTVMRISPTLMRRVLEEFPNAAQAMHGVLSSELGHLAAGLDRVRDRFLAVDRKPG